MGAFGDSEVHEPLDQFKLEGYYPAFVGQTIVSREIIHQRYVLVSKHGWDDYSITWVAKDFLHDVYVRLRVLKAKPKLLRLLLDEIEFHQLIEKEAKTEQYISFLASLDIAKKRSASSSPVSKLLNAFIFKSPYGYYAAAAYEMIGTPLSKVVQSHYAPGTNVDPQIAAKVTSELAQILELTKQAKIVNLGITPHTVLLVPTEEVLSTYQTNDNHDKSVDELISRHKKLLKKHHIAKMQVPTIKDNDIKHNTKETACGASDSNIDLDFEPKTVPTDSLAIEQLEGRPESKVCLISK